MSNPTCSTKPGNFFKFSSLILDIGTKSLVFRLRCEVAASGLNFSDFLSNHKHDLFHLHEKRKCCQCTRDKSRSFWTKQQWSVLFTATLPLCSSKGECICQYNVICKTEEELDITLLSSILINICTLSPAEKQDIINLRNQRNEFFAHASKAELDEAMYKTEFGKAVGNIESIAYACRKQEIYDEIHNDIQVLIQSPLDDKLCTHVISMLHYVKETTDEQLDDVLQKLRALELQHDIREKIEQRQEKMEIDQTLLLEEIASVRERQQNVDIELNSLKDELRIATTKNTQKRSSSNAILIGPAIKKAISDMKGKPVRGRGTTRTVHVRITVTPDKDRRELLENINTACRKGCTDELQHLLQKLQALPNKNISLQIDSDGYSGLHHAAKDGNIAVLKTLVNHGINVTEKTTGTRKRTILHIACLHGQLEICRYILNNFQIMLHGVDDMGWNAAFCAASGGYIEILELLKDYGINIKHINTKEQNILHIACESDKLEMCRYIVSQYHEITTAVDQDGCNAAFHAICSGNIRILETLMQSGIDIRQRNRYKQNILHFACKVGRLEMCQHIILECPDMLHEVDDNGYNTAIHAVLGRKLEILELLLQNGVNFRHCTNDKRNILNIACFVGEVGIVQYIISRFPDMVDETDINGSTAVHHVVGGGNIQILQLFKDNGADMKRKNIFKNNILHIGCLNKKLEMCRYIISQYPAMMEEVDIKGGNVAHSAVEKGTVEILELLKNSGVNMRHTNRLGWNILHVACNSNRLDMCRYIVSNCRYLLHAVDIDQWNAALHASRGGNVQILKLLKDNKVNMNHKNKDDWNMIHIACQAGKLDLLDYVISEYPDMLHDVDKHGWNAALHAARGGSIVLLERLKHAGVDMNRITNKNLNILNVACETGRLPICKYIITKYPDMIENKDNEKCSIAHHAARGGNGQILELLREHGEDMNQTNDSKCNILHVACVNGALNMSLYIISQYPDMLQKIDINGWNCALHAARGGNVDILEHLTKSGVDIFHTSVAEWNILHVACHNGKLGICQYVIEKYPDMVFAVDKYGWNTALHAGAGGNVKILELLKDRGVDMRHRNKCSYNILHVACLNGRVDMVQFALLHYPEMRNEVDHEGWTSAHHAIQSGNFKILELLKNCGADLTLRSTVKQRNILHAACMFCKLDVIQYIISNYPCLLHEVDSEGWNATHFVAYFFHKGDSRFRDQESDVIDFLVKKGVDVYRVTSNGDTVLSLCAQQKKMALVKHLLNLYPGLSEIKGPGIVKVTINKR